MVKSHAHGWSRAAVALTLRIALASLIAGGVSAQSLYPNPAKPATKWRLAWSDEFNGPPCDLANPRKCSFKDWSRTVQCFGSPDQPVNTVTPFAFHVDPADPRQYMSRYFPHLANLDKCNWLVSDHINGIHFLGPRGPITRYNPDNVTVSGGEMRITSRRMRPGADCGRALSPDGPNNEANRSKDCPYEGGNVFSFALHGLAAAGISGDSGSASGMNPGDGHLFHEGGRLEIRSRIPAEPGSMTALWTWQYDWRVTERELDLLENWVNWPEMTLHSVQGPNTTVQHVLSPEFRDTLSREFHTYAMEWKRNDSFSYYLDNRHLATWRDSSRPDGDRIKANGQCVDNPIRANPFYMIMWNLIAEYEFADPQFRPADSGQRPDTLYVDYIRYYEHCNDSKDASCVESTLNPVCANPCAGFGAFDGYNCYVGTPPAGRDGTIANGQFAYKAKWTLFGGYSCPNGGTRSGSKCLLGGAPPGRATFVYDNNFYATATCSTTRLPNCANPCTRRGTFYDAASGTCRGGSGATAVSYPVERCPYGGAYDPAANACVIVSLPAGAETAVWEGALYYRSAGGSCPYGGWFDGANCYLQGTPDGVEPIAVGNRISSPAQCGPATDWQTLQRVAGQATINNVCKP